MLHRRANSIHVIHRCRYGHTLTLSAVSDSEQFYLLRRLGHIIVGTPDLLLRSASGFVLAAVFSKVVWHKFRSFFRLPRISPPLDSGSSGDWVVIFGPIVVGPFPLVTTCSRHIKLDPTHQL